MVKGLTKECLHTAYGHKQQCGDWLGVGRGTERGNHYNSRNNKNKANMINLRYFQGIMSSNALSDYVKEQQKKSDFICCFRFESILRYD